ncbi:MAG: hypothetical protein ACOX2P_04565 [Bacillota bacterium]
MKIIRLSVILLLIVMASGIMGCEAEENGSSDLLPLEAVEDYEEGVTVAKAELMGGKLFWAFALLICISAAYLYWKYKC